MVIRNLPSATATAAHPRIRYQFLAESPSMTLTKVCSVAVKSSHLISNPLPSRKGPLLMLAGGELVGSNSNFVFIVCAAFDCMYMLQ